MPIKFDGERQHSTPLVIDRLDEMGTARVLERIPLLKRAETAEQHDEAWLQKLIFQFPQVLPVAEIEPRFVSLVPICMELPTSSGYADNLYVTGSGDLVLAECKLWRNPEARREVVAQIIDYAHSMASWSYDDLQAAVKRGIRIEANDSATLSLFEMVREVSELKEADFIDAVSRNLRLGRMLLLIVGDGIREGVETLTEYLQMHAGFHFTLSLIEVPVYQLPGRGYVIQPRVLARTVNIERGIVRITDPQVGISPVATAAVEQTSARRTSITQDRFLEMLSQEAPEVPPLLEASFERLAEVGVLLQPATKSLQLKWRAPDDQMFNLGGISTDGYLHTFSVGWVPDSIGRIDLSHEYMAAIAAIVGGTVRETPKPSSWYVVAEGTTNPRAADLLQHLDAWIAAIQSYTEKLTKAVEE